jgi:peptide/nickel transport system substrate-binding protein
LLANAGWSDTDSDGVLDKNGKPLKVTLWAVAGDPVDEPLAFAIRDMLGQVGFQVLLQLDDRDEMLTRLFLHEFDLAIAPWNIPLDPDQHWYWQSTENTPGEGLNFGSYSNPQVDDLLERGNLASGCDSNVRRAIYGQVYRTIANDLPQVFLFAPPVYVQARTRVFGLDPSAFAGDYWNINAWQVAP